MIGYREDSLARIATTKKTPRIEQVHPVMVIEDHPDVREIMTLLLKSMNREVITAENGRKALEHLQQSGDTPPCLILLDLMMPEMNGFQFLEAIEKESRFSHIPVVVISAVADLVTELPNVCETLTRPTSFKELSSVVSRYC